LKESIKTDISVNLNENLIYIENLLKDNSDIIFREFNIGKYKAFLMYVDGMGDKILLNDFILETLMIEKMRSKASGILRIKYLLLQILEKKKI